MEVGRSEGYARRVGRQRTIGPRYNLSNVCLHSFKKLAA